jgi:hypothetical protein
MARQIVAECEDGTSRMTWTPSPRNRPLPPLPRPEGAKPSPTPRLRASAGYSPTPPRGDPPTGFVPQPRLRLSGGMRSAPIGSAA